MSEAEGQGDSSKSVSKKTVPPFFVLDEKREKCIDDLLEKIKEKYDPLPLQLIILKDQTKDLNAAGGTLYDAERVYAYTFLQSREWKVDKAFVMVEQVVQYRKDFRLDEVALFPSPFSVRGFDTETTSRLLQRPPRPPHQVIDRISAGIDPYTPMGLHYRDRLGQPVLYLLLGRSDQRQLLKNLKTMAEVRQLPSDVYFQYLQHAIGVGEVCVYHSQHLQQSGTLANDEGIVESAKIAPIIRSVTFVVDMSGFTHKMIWKPALQLFEDEMQRLFLYYPDFIHRILVVNCPGAVKTAYNVVKGSFDETFKKKITFHSPDVTQTALLEVIDKKYLPSFLGGECKCEGHCIASFDPESQSIVKPEESEDFVETEYVTVAARKKFTKNFGLTAGDCVNWEFSCNDGHHIVLSLYFVPKQESQSVDWNRFSEKSLSAFAVDSRKISEGASGYQADQEGTLVLVWDNSKSWFSERKMQLKVFKVDSAENSNNNQAEAGSSNPVNPDSETRHASEPDYVNGRAES